MENYLPGSPKAFAHMRALELIRRGYINEFKELFDSYGLQIQSENDGLIISYIARSGSIEKMIQLLKWGLPIQLETLDGTISYEINSNRYAPQLIDYKKSMIS